MDNKHGIIVFGASGSGCTTMGRELARLLNFKHFDTDDYFFVQNNPPLAMKERPLDERISLLRPLVQRGNFVLSGCIREWGGALDSLLSMAVFLLTPTNIRIERVENRELNRNGERIKAGGEFYAQHRKFIDYIATYDNGGMESRSLASQEAWASNLTCPVVRVNGALDLHTNTKDIIAQFYTHTAVKA
ncbi:MAG: AAA family ATPase [Defluviitaleaceae bacterium]|nr:AAA family ATPase [Defluviitaleaceae bacterium]